MLGYRRPPDHKRRRLLECWRVGITAVFPLVSYRLSVTYSFIPSSLSRPSSPRIHGIFSLADRPHPLLRPWFCKPNASPTSMIVPSFLGPPWPARPGHLHPFVHRLTKGAHTYIDHLIGCAQPWGYSVIILHPLLRTSQLRHPRSMCHYIYHPMAPISALKTRKSFSLDTAFTLRRFSLSCIHPQPVVVMGRGNAAHADGTHR